MTTATATVMVMMSCWFHEQYNIVNLFCQVKGVCVLHEMRKSKKTKDERQEEPKEEE